MPRLFIGWPLPPDLRERIEGTTEQLRANLPAASWTRPGTYHLTFAFLGEQPESMFRPVGEALAHNVGTVPPAHALIGEPGFFPSRHRPRVGWLGMADGFALDKIAEAVRSAVLATGIQLDVKPFHAHLTLLRVRARWSSSDVDLFLSAWEGLQGTPLLVDSVTLFESRLGPGGAKHIPRVVADCRGTDPAMSS